MEIKHKISAAQFFIAMFVSRAVVTIALNAQYTGSENMLDSVVSYMLAVGLGFLIAWPIWALHKQYPNLPVDAVAQREWGKAGKAVSIFYVAYFILVNGASLGLFEIFLLDTVNPDFSAAFIIAALLAVGLYGAARGIETVARCSTCVFVVLLLGTLLVFGAVAARFREENLEPLFYGGYSSALQGVMLFIARTSIFADMAVLLPFVRGRKKWGFACWSLGTAAFVGLLLFLLAGCLGRYASTQNFPVHVLAAVTEIRSLQRLDAVFIGIWMMGLVIKLSCDLYACRVCISALTQKKASRWWIAAAGGPMLLLALWAADSMGFRGILLDVRFLFFFTLLAGALLPLLVWGTGEIKRRKKKGGN